MKPGDPADWVFSSGVRTHTAIREASIRDEIAPGLRAIPAGRKTVVAFTVDDGTREVLIYAVSYAGADWVARSTGRHP